MTVHTERIKGLARDIVSRRIRSADVPIYDRAAVQEVLLQWWLERRPPRRAPSFQAVLPDTPKRR